MDEETLKESAKAAQEVAKTAGKAIDAGRDAGGWLDRIFGEAIESTVAHLWTDRVKARRIAAAIYDWERLVKLFHKADARLQKLGKVARRIPPPKVMLPLLEHATMEHEEDLHTLYANLLATAVDEDADEIERKFVSALAEMSGADARTLKMMFAEWMYWEDKKIGSKNDKRYESGMNGFPGHDETSVVLFYRLGLILPVSVEVINEYHKAGHDEKGDWGVSTEKTVVSDDLQVVDFTEFGERFCKASIGDVKDLYTPPDWVKAGTT